MNRTVQDTTSPELRKKCESKDRSGALTEAEGLLLKQLFTRALAHDPEMALAALREGSVNKAHAVENDNIPPPVNLDPTESEAEAAKAILRRYIDNTRRQTASAQHALEKTEVPIEEPVPVSAGEDLRHFFNFDELQEPASPVSYAMTTAFRAGLKKLAQRLEMKQSDLVRRAVFAVACAPKSLDTPCVNRLDHAHRISLAKRGPKPRQDF